MVSGERQDPTQEGGDIPARAARLPAWLRSDSVVGCVIIIFVAIVFAITTTFEEVPLALSQGIPPEQFPRILVGVMALLAIVMIVQSYLQPEIHRKGVPLMVLWTAGLLILFVVLIDSVGMVAAMFLFCLALPVLWGEKRYLWVTVYAVLFPACIYVLFSVLLEVRFPFGFFSR